MTTSGPALIAAAAGVGFGHAVLPDHWVPLALLGRTRRYPISRIARLSGLAGLAHVLVSILLGAAIIVIGLQFRSAIQTAQQAIVGSLLLVTGIAFLALDALGGGHHHSGQHSHAPVLEPGGQSPRHRHPTRPASRRRVPGRLQDLAAVMVPFGAAASPDITILPVFLAAATAGVATAMASLVVFALVTVGTIVILTLAAARGGYEIQGRWLERWGNGLTALVLVLIGLLVLTGVL
ncbi:MAG TPA: hypothetical protein VE983_00870 [Solirubrobacteraceae bacterium]|nr:hypothetical protein [Solirubrobacteraceae bacterium]